jgi:hypothetical protein
MQTEFPTIRATVDAIKSLITEPFQIVYMYSGNNDSGWFDYFEIRDAATDTNIPNDNARDLVHGNKAGIEEELYTLLGGRFPGWEIGDGHVQGSHGYFTIDSKTSTITQNHVVDYNEEDDQSPDEEVTF